MRKKRLVHGALCAVLTAAMAVAQPLAVLADTAEGDAGAVLETTLEEGSAEPEGSLQPGGEESAQPGGEESAQPGEAESGQPEEAESGQPEDGADSALQNGGTEDNIASEPQVEAAQTAANGELGISAQSETAPVGKFKLPTADLPVLEAGKTYTANVHFYNVSTLEEYQGDIYASYSMADMLCLKTIKTELEAQADGSVRATVHLHPEAACHTFNLFDSEEDYKAYINSEEPWLPEIQALKKGGTPDSPTDGVVYTTQEVTYAGETMDGIEDITFTLPSASPLVYFAVTAEGMGSQEQYGILGFEFDKIEGVGGTEEPDPTPTPPVTPDPTPAPEEPGTETDDRPETDDPVVQKFWTFYDYWYDEFKVNYTYGGPLAAASVENKFLDVYAVRIKDGSLTDEDKAAIDEKLEYLAEVMLNPSYAVKNSDALEPGKVYEVPVKFYDQATEAETFFGDTVTAPGVSGSVNESATEYLKDTAIVTLNGKESWSVQFIAKQDSTPESDYLRGFSGDTLAAGAGTGVILGYQVTAERYEGVGFSGPVKAVTLTPSMKRPLDSGPIYLSFSEYENSESVGAGYAAAVLDYDNAVEIGEADTTASENSIGLLKGVIENLEKWQDGTGAQAWLYDQYRDSVTEEIMKEGGLYDQAKAVLEKEQPTENEVYGAYTAIVNYYGTQKSVELYLREALLEAARLTESDYTKYSWNAYYTFAEKVQEIPGVFNEDPGAEHTILNYPWADLGYDEGVLQIYVKKNAIMKELDEKLQGLKGALVSVVSLKDAAEAAKEYDNSNGSYSKGSFDVLTEAVSAAEALIASEEEITAQQVSAAEAAIADAVDGLVNLTVLKAAIDVADAKILETDVYTEASLSLLKEKLNTAKIYYYQNNPTKENVESATAELVAQISELVRKSDEDLDINDLADGTYSVVVNLWHATQDKASMGDDALYHSAVLTVEDGVYTLRITGHTMTVSGQTGELDAMRIIPDGSEPMGDGSNYVEQTIERDGDNYYVDIVLENAGELTEYYYGGIKVHTVAEDGSIGYPMGQTWIANRLRISWETLSVLDVENYPAFSAVDSATGIRVTAPEGALPAGTILEVTKITDGDRLAEITTALGTLADKNTPYQISLYVEKDGVRESVEPAEGMELTITLPVPDGYDTSKVGCYYLDENNYTNLLSGTLDGSTYTVVNGKIGAYVMVERKVKESNYTVTNRPGTTTTTTTRPTTTTTANRTSTVKTGDETVTMLYVFLLLGGACAASGCAVLFRRRRTDV